MYFLFDVGNVVILGEHNMTYERLERLGVDAECARQFFKAELYRDFSRGLLTGEEFAIRLARECLQKELTPQKVQDAHDVHIYGVDAGVLDILRSIPSGQLGFLTDTNEWQTSRERELVDLSRFSDTIFRSHEIGMLKQDDGCFPYVVNRLGIEPSEIVFVDDSPEKIEKAREVGIRTILFTDADAARRRLQPFLE